MEGRGGGGGGGGVGDSTRSKTGLGIGVWLKTIDHLQGLPAVTEKDENTLRLCE